MSTSVLSSLKQLSSQLQAEQASSATTLPTDNATQQGASSANNKTEQRASIQQNQQINNVSPSNNGMTGVLAKQVSAAVENSGLFYESHLQQWANGQRSTDQLSKEPQARFGQEQVISEKGLNPSAVDQSAKLVSAQLATLDTNRISLALSGLLGQPVQLEIEPDNEDKDSQDQQGSEEPARPWVARLKLDMAHLGELQVRVRMIGSQCDVQISGSAHSKKAIDPHWQEFKVAMDNQGLKLVHGQFTLPSEG